MIDDLLRDFQANKIHIAIVVDEFGGTSGIVTMEDLIEEIVGEINDEYDEDERSYVKLAENVYVFEAKTLLSDFYKILKVDPDDFEEAAGDSDTLAGLLLELKGEFPVLHETLEYRNFRFEVLEMNSRRILKVKVTVSSSEDGEADPEEKELIMPLLRRWEKDGGLWGIWHVTETEDGLMALLADKSLFAGRLAGIKV